MDGNGRTVDLSLAKPGDECELRNGRIHTFHGSTPPGVDWADWPYVVGSIHYTRSGHFHDKDTEDEEDIVRVTRNGVQITPAAEPEKCCLCDSPMKDGHCTGDTNGCVMTPPAAPAAVITGPGKYVENGDPDDIAEVVAEGDGLWFGFDSQDKPAAWNLAGNRVIAGGHEPGKAAWRLTGRVPPPTLLEACDALFEQQRKTVADREGFVRLKVDWFIQLAEAMDRERAGATA